MLNTEQNQILEQAIILLFKLKNDQAIEKWEVNREREFETAIRTNTDGMQLPSILNKNEGILKFTSKELNKMPKEIKTALEKKNGDHIRQKENGVYEIRLTFEGKLYYGSSKNLAEAKRKFINSIISAAPIQNEEKNFLSNDITIVEYAYHYLETFKKPNIGKDSLNNYLSEVKNHIAPFFKTAKMTEITGTACQQLLNKILDAGKGRLGEDINQLLNWICKSAVADGIIKSNPMRTVKIPKHWRAEGKQIPAPLVQRYLNKEPHTNYDFALWLMAFSGIRPVEIKSIKIAGNFMTIANAKKRKSDRQTYRRIPLHSVLQPYVCEIEAAKSVNTDYLAQVFHKNFPKEYRLYDLRHTFTSRIQELDANKQWVDYATAHTNGQNTTDRVYTHWSDEFQIAEMEKLDYKSQI